jgi:hypothetical protein
MGGFAHMSQHHRTIFTDSLGLWVSFCCDFCGRDAGGCLRMCGERAGS